MLKIKRNVVALGLTSFFTDVSSEMIMVLLPLFLTALGAGKGLVGLIEGVADASSGILKVFSGWFSDRLGKRKILVVTGYTLSTAAKPFMAIANSWVQVLGIRFTDRLGKGLRDAPRDALLADSSAHDGRGVAFGFHRSMDTAGAMVGTLLASLFLYLFSRVFVMDTVFQYRTIFWISVIPGILSILTLIFFVREIPAAIKKEESDSPEVKTRKRNGFKRFLLVMAIFELANFSYAIFILRAADLGVAIAAIPLIYLIYNIAYSSLSTPFGQLSDRVGRKMVLLLGFVVFSLMLFGFAISTEPWQAWVLFAFYGLAVAVVETIPRAMVADFVSSERRATSYGVYHTMVGLVTLPASSIAGGLWDIYGKVEGPKIAFGYGAAVALIAALLLWLLIPERKTHGQ